MHIFPQIPSGRSIDIFHRVDSNATQAGTLSSTLRVDRPHEAHSSHLQTLMLMLMLAYVENRENDPRDSDLSQFSTMKP